MAKEKAEAPKVLSAADKAAKAAEAARLKAEVASFAAELGLSTAAAAADSFDDFAPEKAKVVIQAQPAPSKAPKARPAEPKQGRQQKEALPVAAPAAAAEKGAQAAPVVAEDDPIRSRTWNAGVGPRPGQVRSRSLQARDEPNIWFEAAAALPALDASASTAPPLDEDAAELKRQEAERLLEHEADVFEKDLQKRNAADARWLQQVRRAGTTQDKIAAMTLLVQESAIANMRSLDGLLALFAKRKGGRQVVSQALEALQELFLTILLPDRKLKVFEQQPLQALPSGKEGERCLLFWVAEDAVKRRYSQFITLLEETSIDQLDFLKERAIKAMHVLLAAKSEGEARLLAALVNKLGDPNRKIASNAGFFLGQLLLKHPVMKPVVVREVERFVFRPALSDRARYYAVITLNQLVLSRRSQEGGDALAAKLIDLYFSLFALIMGGKLGNAATLVEKEEAKNPKGRHKHDKSKGGKRSRGGKSKGAGHKHPHKPAVSKPPNAAEMDARMLSALIAGVRRAFPFVAKGQVDELVDKHSEALFRLIHTAPFSVALQALLLLFQLLSGREAVSDRFYRALYDVLLADGPFAATKAPMFMSLLYKAMRQDVHAKRVAAFTKRLLQVASQASPNWAAGALLMVSEALRQHPSLWSALQQPEDHGDEQERFRDITDSDEDEPTAQKRLPGPQVANGTPGVDAGAASDGDEDGGAMANGVQLNPSGKALVVRRAPASADVAAAQRAASGAHASGSGRCGEEQVWPAKGYYDMRKREPLYAAAETSCWWELVLLASHAHPSVSAFARTLLSGVHVVYDGDPLKDLTLPTFLDKFMQRKPKSLARGSSLMQPLGGRRPSAQGRSAADVGSDAFAALERVRVAPADAFFHKYYNLQTTKTAKDKKRKRAGAGSDDEAGSDEFESDVSDTEADRVLTGVEGGGGGDKSRLLADVAPGAAGEGDFDYDALMGAMGEEELSGSGEEEEEEEGQEGEVQEEEGEEAGSSDVSSDWDEDEEDEDESEEGDEGYVMLEERPPGKRARTSRADAADDVTDADLEGINIFDLPSASSSDADEDDGDAGAAPPRAGKRSRGDNAAADGSAQRKRRKGAAAADADGGPGSNDADYEELEDMGIDDLDLDDLMGGSDSDLDAEMLPSDSSDDGAGMGAVGTSSDEEGAGRAAATKKGRKGLGGGGKDGMSDFASADDYAAFFDKLDKQQQQRGDEGAAPPTGSQQRQHQRRGTPGGGKHGATADKQQKPAAAASGRRKPGNQRKGRAVP